MKILLITPAPPGSRAGNRATAERWAGLLESAGHQVQVTNRFSGEPCDLVLALHAWRSHADVTRIRREAPGLPLVVALTGTDIYDHQNRYPEQTRDSMAKADSLIGLHRLVDRDIPETFRHKLFTVLQSAPVPAENTANRTESEGRKHGGNDTDPRAPFVVSVIGHLRDEKDSLRAARAARRLPEQSRVTVLAAGRAHDQRWEEMAREEAADNPRFRWLGELDQKDTAELLLGSRLMVLSSIMEGGANVVSEACRAGIPVIASDIPGNRGLLGEDYPGYFQVGDDEALAALLLKAEQQPAFLALLKARVSDLASDFTPEREQASLLRAIHQAVKTSRSG